MKGAALIFVAVCLTLGEGLTLNTKWQFPGFPGFPNFNPWGALTSSSGTAKSASLPFMRHTPSLTRTSNGKIDVCYVHIGKTGGESVNKALENLQDAGVVRDIVQIHQQTDHSHDKHRQKVAGPAIGGPHEKDCANTGNVLIWVRDPIARFVSCWKAHLRMEMHGDTPGHDVHNAVFPILNRHKLAQKRNHASMDLDKVLTQMSTQPDGHQVLSKVLKAVPHAAINTEFYLGDCQHLDNLPIKFVGTTENMSADWQEFIGMIGGADVPMVHKNAHKMEGDEVPKTLSPAALQFLAEQPEFQGEMRCMEALVKRGLVSSAWKAGLMDGSKEYKY